MFISHIEMGFYGSAALKDVHIDRDVCRELGADHRLVTGRVYTSGDITLPARLGEAVDQLSLQASRGIFGLADAKLQVNGLPGIPLLPWEQYAPALYGADAHRHSDWKHLRKGGLDTMTMLTDYLQGKYGLSHQILHTMTHTTDDLGLRELIRSCDADLRSGITAWVERTPAVFVEQYMQSFVASASDIQHPWAGVAAGALGTASAAKAGYDTNRQYLFTDKGQHVYGQNLSRAIQHWALAHGHDGDSEFVKNASLYASTTLEGTTAHMQRWSTHLNMTASILGTVAGKAGIVLAEPQRMGPVLGEIGMLAAAAGVMGASVRRHIQSDETHQISALTEQLAKLQEAANTATGQRNISETQHLHKEIEQVWQQWWSLTESTYRKLQFITGPFPIGMATLNSAYAAARPDATGSTLAPFFLIATTLAQDLYAYWNHATNLARQKAGVTTATSLNKKVQDIVGPLPSLPLPRAHTGHT